ncbi:hypothetical protein M758_1G035800 [Ceratodon purpureus]|nr:hypothetical protein M758_1G035800 [Ceratodon purpureus]
MVMPILAPAMVTMMCTGEATMLLARWGGGRWGHLPPTPVRRGGSHAGGAAAAHPGVALRMGLPSGDASAGGAQPRARCRGRGWGRLKSCAAEVHCDVVSVPEGGDGDGVSDGQRRMQAFRERVRGRAVVVEDVASLYEYPLDDFQESGVSGFLEGFSLVVCAPTSSGKTLIAEAAAAAILARGKRLFYTTPLKALSNQKLREFQQIFGEDNVGILTGDTVWNRKAPIMVMTTEILRNMLYDSVGSILGKGWLVDVDAIVLDEVHYLSDISRGTVWEETIIYSPKDVQLICLSATVSNPEDLASWIERVHGPTKLVTASKRPVPLQWHFSTRQALLPLLNEESTAMNPKLKINQEKENKRMFMDYFGDELSKKGQSSPLRTRVGFGGKDRGESRMQKSKETEKKLTEEQIMFLRRKQVPKIKDTLMQLKERDMLPAIWFIFSRKGCDLAVSYVEDCNLLSDDEARQVQEALREYQQQYPEAIRDIGVKALMQGAAAHHAGCLPTWKAFIEELFQRGLVKVVFTTETLAAGINMPARTAVLSSMSKRGNDGHTLLSSNAMLQMAGRAGRRGIDNQGHVVVVQTAFEGAEDAVSCILAGPEPLVSQFTTTYGMVLNLLAGPRVANRAEKSDDERDTRLTRRARTLDETRALVEQSFGNFIGSDILVSAQQHLTSLRQEIDRLQAENTSEGFFSTLSKELNKKQLQEYVTLSKKVAEAKDHVRKSQQMLQHSREKMIEQVMEECGDSRLAYVCVEYVDQLTGQEHMVSVACVGSFLHPPLGSDLQESELLELNSEEDESAISITSDVEDTHSMTSASPQYVGLGFDNCWYVFTGGSVSCIYNNSLSKPENPGECVGTLLKERLQADPPMWKKAGESGSSSSCAVWNAGSEADTSRWASQVPPIHELPKEWQKSSDVVKAEKVFANTNEDLVKLNKKLKLTQGYRKYKLLLDLQQKRKNKIANLQSTASSIDSRMKQLQPSGWKDFLQVMGVLQSAGALDAESNALLPLGETAAVVRGANELWLTLTFMRDVTYFLKPSQLAAACGALVSEGMKTRNKQISSARFSESRGVRDWVIKMEDLRSWLLRLQASHGVEIPVGLDKRFAGIVEAWASGVSWQELIEHSGMDEGDAARLLRQTLDLVSQIVHLPHVDPGLEQNARAARAAMDRSPISELFV